MFSIINPKQEAHQKQDWQMAKFALVILLEYRSQRIAVASSTKVNTPSDYGIKSSAVFSSEISFSITAFSDMLEYFNSFSHASISA